MLELTPIKVGARGPEDSPFVIVGEAPGKEEIKQLLPFVGPSGTVLQHALDVIPKELYPEPYITNTFKSLITFDKDPERLKALAMECRPALLEEIGKHKRRVILASGAVALMALTGDTSLKITQVRGKIFPSPLADVGIIAAVHPAFLLRGNGSFREFKSDIAHAILIAQGHEPHHWEPPTWSIIQTPEEIEEQAKFLMAQEPGFLVAGDIETSGFSPRYNKILNMGHTWDGKHIHITCGYKTDALTKKIAPNLIHHYGKLFHPKHIKWGWHNGKFDCKFFHAIGQTDARVDEDSMLQSYSLDERRGIHDLETVSGDWLYSPNWKGVLDKYLPNKKTSYDAIPWDVLFKYAAYDIANTYRLIKFLGDLIATDKLAHKQYHFSLVPASAYLMNIEQNGIPVAQDVVAANYERLWSEAEPMKAQLCKIAEELRPGNFSDKLPNSPTQLAEVIFDCLNLKPAKGPNIRSTNDDILGKLPQVPFIKTLRLYRKKQKALSTYVTPYLHGNNDSNVEDDGKVHTTYLIHGTATGRLSSREPNLQNIPRDPAIRGMFVARPGRMFIEPDLNQAELRSLAILSEDPVLCQVYLDGKESLHEVTRRGIFGNPSDWSPSDVEGFLQKFNIPPDERYINGEDRIKAEQKMIAKNVNFGIIYGITEAGLSEQTGQEPKDCREWLTGWASTYPVAWKFIQTCRMASLFGKNIVTVFGYRKRFEIVTREKLTDIQNESANFPHQSTASVITMHGGIRTYKKIEEHDCYFINTVHDSLLIDAPLDYHVARTVTDLVTAELEQVPKDWGLTKIPFKADAKWGTKWGSLTDDQEAFARSQGWLEAA